MPTTFASDLAKQLCSVLPESLQKVEQDIQMKFNNILQSKLSNLDLVSREEFDVLTKVLNKTREKVDKLEANMEKSD